MGNSLPSGHGFQSSYQSNFQRDRAPADKPQTTRTSPGAEGRRSAAAPPRVIMMVVNRGFKNRQIKKKQKQKTILGSSRKITAVLNA